MNNEYIADKGKIWRNKVTGLELNRIMYLGKGDNIYNYEQIDDPDNEITEENINIEDNIGG
jgi:hypothetical protein